MAITVYVDLSAKVEQWTRDSAVAMASDDQQCVVFVSSSIKRKIKARLEELHGRKSINYRVLALLIYLSVRDSIELIDQIVIDKDYDGRQVEATITNLLLALIRRHRPNATAGMIRFENIKGSKADRLAKQVYDGEVKPDHSPKWGEISKILGK